MSEQTKQFSTSEQYDWVQSNSTWTLNVLHNTHGYLHASSQMGIPYYTTFSEFRFGTDAYASISSGSPRLFFYLGKPGSYTSQTANVDSWDKETTRSLSTSYKTYYSDNIASYLNSTYNSAGASKGYFGDRAIYFSMRHSGTYRKFYWKNLYFKAVYTLPTVNINLTAGTGGSVSGGGTITISATGTNYSKTITATPEAGYTFVKWSDGNTNATRTLTYSETTISQNVTDVNLTATFKKDETTKINKIYVGTSQPSKIYVGTTEVKEVYVGTTKVYG